MKYLIFSDSHGASVLTRRILGEQQADTDGVIFLGDGLREFRKTAAEFPKLDVHAVAGNCDFDVSLADQKAFEQFFELEGFRIMITHGHRHFVKMGTDYIADYARQKGADVVLFGHTHQRLETWLPPVKDGEKGLYLFNPGSITLPKDDRLSYGVLTIRNGQILLSHGILGE
ncbi:MAG: YfcE family phosphodiesterase [Clostridia bacterium]|nr:YfcE family phosphodiesterase [Clostridia bacterium]